MILEEVFHIPKIKSINIYLNILILYSTVLYMGYNIIHSLFQRLTCFNVYLYCLSANKIFKHLKKEIMLIIFGLTLFKL